MINSHKIILSVLAIKLSMTSSTLIATLQIDCACYGNDETIDSIMPNCTASNGSIAINSVYHAAKNQSTGCPLVVTDADRDEPNCCTYNEAEDCQIALTSSDILVANVFNDCAGSTTCSKRATWQDTILHCPTGYLTQTNYMCIEYYCFPVSDSAPFCDSSNTVYMGSQLFFYNDNYPSPISISNCCSCMVTASATSATIDVNMIDFRLYDVASQCLQSLTVEDGTNLTSFDCSTNNDFVIQKLMTSSTNSLTITLKNNATTAEGYIWMGLIVSHGGLTLSCSPVTTCTGSSSMTTTTTTNPLSTAAASDDEESSPLLGMSMLAFILTLTGALLTLVSLITCIGCCIAYLMKKYKSYDVKNRDKKKPDRQKRKRKSPPSYVTPTPFTQGKPFPQNDVPTERRFPDNCKNTVFVYRPHENRYLADHFSKSRSLPRVETT